MTIQLDSQKVASFYHLQNRRRQAIHSARFKSASDRNPKSAFARRPIKLSGHELACFLSTLDDLTLPGLGSDSGSKTEPGRGVGRLPIFSFTR